MTIFWMVLFAKICIKKKKICLFELFDIGSMVNESFMKRYLHTALSGLCNRFNSIYRKRMRFNTSEIR